MLAIFLHIINHKKRLKFLVIIFCFLISNNYYSQKASYFENISENEGLPSNYIFNAAEDHNHVIWFGTDKGLVTYQDGKWLTLDIDNGMPGNYISNLVSDDKNGLLIYVLNKGLYYFNTNTKTLLKKYNEIGTWNSLKIKKATKDKNLIIVHVISSTGHQSSFYAFDRNNIKRLLPLRIINNGKEKLLSLTNGKIISDLSIFENPEKIKFENFTLEQNPLGIIRKENNKIVDTLTEENGLASNFISDIIKKNNGDIYVTTLGGGISILKKNNSKISFLNKNINVRDIICSNEKKYVISDGSLYVINKNRIENKYFLRKDILSFNVYGDELLIGSFEGLHFYKLTPKPVLIKTFPITTGISKIYKEGKKVIFSTYGEGIFVLENGKTENFENIYFNNIENLFNITSGYAATSYDYGAIILDKKFQPVAHLNKNNGLESNFVTCAFSDNDTIYIGTKKGLTTYYKNKTIQKFTSKKDFHDDAIKSIFRDNKKQIWILTDKNIYKKSGYTVKPLGSLRLIDDNKDRIIQGQYSVKENQLFLVTKNEFSIIKLNKVIPNKHTNPVVLEKIIANNENLNLKDKIVFTDSDKDIYFIFKSIDKEILTQSKLFYKINKDSWRPFNQPRSLKFSPLERGNYTLSIKVINEDGYEGYLKNPIKFKVIGPFYIRWWFIMLTGILASILIYNYVNEQNKKKYVKRLNLLRVKHQVENERRRISRDLHDNIGAYVTRLISKIDLLKTDANNITDENCNDVRLDAEHILALLRQTIFILSNKETTIIALYDNFKTYAQKFFQTDNIKIIFEENAENNRKLDPTTSSSLYRIMQEALQNIHKHASATKVEINVISKDKIIIFIKDNGKGFKKEELKFGYGLQNMKERALEVGFKFNIYSDNTGTIIELYEI